MLKRWLAVAAIFALVATACTAGGEDPGPAPEPPTTDTGSQEPVTLEMWGAWTGRELDQFNQIFDGFTEQYPWITVRSRGGVGDQKIITAINSGEPPDVVLSFVLDNIGQFCASGAWQDLTPYMERDGFDLSQFPDAALQYTSFAGSQCALPFLTDAYGLYYNVDMFDEAGITEPPQTLSELADVAKQLTVFASDGSIERAGIVMATGYYETTVLTMGSMFGVEWYSEDGTQSAIDDDPAWTEFFEWQHDFIADVYGEGDFQTGADRLERFVAGQGDEFSTAQDFQAGRVAMNLDGEWRTAFIADEAPDLNYETAPFPVPDDRADQYGMGQIGGTIIGIPRGSDNPEEAWLLLQYMATDTDTLVYMANNVRNVPTTVAALESPDLDVTPQFQTFLDIFQNPLSHYKQHSAIGSADQTTLADFAARWQTGAATDLQGGLQQVAQQIDDQLAQAAL
jgi:multiple sugar transport system substrate-binding protein